MKIGVPKEIKDHEYRVGITPAGVKALVNAGHKVYIEKGAGLGSGISDHLFKFAGANIIKSAKEVYSIAEMIIKVKEPLASEYSLLKENQILYTFLHLASSRKLTQALINRKVIAVGYETIQIKNGTLPLLTPMSEIAGKMSIQIGASYLQKDKGGRGILLGGVPGVKPGTVVILGGGVSGINAAKVAIGLGAGVIILDINLERLAYLDDIFQGRIITLMSNSENIENFVVNADLLVGAVLIPGAKAPVLVKKELVSRMKPGSVIVDISVDQGGCIETCRPTTHSNPIFTVKDVIHYCVTNMPAAVSRTSTFALTNTTLPYALKIANEGLRKAVISDEALAKGVNVFKGKITYPAVAESFGMKYVPVKELI